MRQIDLLTLIVIIAAALQLGLQGFFGWDATGSVLGDSEKYVFMLAGLSGVWQLFRQKLN